MTETERLTRIENALIKAGLLDPLPSPTLEQGIQDMKDGDDSTLVKFFLGEIRAGRMPGRKNADRT